MSGAFGLLILQIVFLLNSLGLMGPFATWLQHRPDSTVRHDVIGEMIQKRENVKRKSADSIIWKVSEPQDVLYKYDSILTLDHSTAQLHLQNDVSLQIQENTLVVLEPLEETSDESLRVRFQRGLMRSRNSGQKLLVGAGDWSVEAAPGSDLSLRALDGDNVELEVNGGEVALKNQDSGKVATIGEGKRLTLTKENIGEIQTVNEDLQFSADIQKRIYSHSVPVAVPLHWQGEAKWLVIGRLNEPEQKIDVHNNIALLSLDVGTYTLSLVAEDGSVSKTQTLEVDPAPKLRYLSPLPRDRVSMDGATLFSWYALDGVQRYEVRFTPEDERATASAQPDETSLAPFARIKPVGPGAYSWSVFAYDLDGIAIPPFYALPVYFTPDPLAAPKLRTPATAPEDPNEQDSEQKEDKTKKPQNFGAFLWKQIFPIAFAEELPPAKPPIERQIVFTWYPVEGADYYVIEISSKSDFLHPEVIQKVSKEEYEWTGFQDEVYYWRVAAGSKSGRMGIFSDPAEFNVKKLKTMDLKNFAGIRYIERPTEKPVEKPTEKPADDSSQKEKKPETETETETEEPRQPPPDTYFEAQGNIDYWVMSQQNKDVDKVNFKGIAVPSMAFGKTWNIGRNVYMSKVIWQQLKWQPESASELPYQDEFTTNILKFKFYSIVQDGFGWGLVVEQVPFIKRTGLEEIKTEDQTLYGGLVNWQTSLSSEIEWRSQGLLTYGDSIFQANWENEVRSYPGLDDGAAGALARRGLYFGGIVDLATAFGSDKERAVWVRMGFEIGYDW